MTRSRISSWVVAAAALVVCAQTANADDADGCAHFTWDVSHELAVMKQTPQAVSAATRPASQATPLQIDKLYEVKLAPQSTVTYAAKPAKPTLNDSAQGGLVHFRVTRAGVYRISITSGHWIDVVDDDELVKSRDFQGARGCERPHKIVEFELAAGRDLVLQFSGSTDASVVMAITPVSAPVAH